MNIVICPVCQNPVDLDVSDDPKHYPKHRAPCGAWCAAGAGGDLNAPPDHHRTGGKGCPNCIAKALKKAAEDAQKP